MMDHFDVIAIGIITTLAGIAYTVLVLAGHAGDAGIFHDVVFIGGGAVAALARVTLPLPTVTVTPIAAPLATIAAPEAAPVG